MKRIHCVRNKKVIDNLVNLRIYYNSNKYKINVFHQEKQSEIIMEIDKDVISTESFPMTFEILNNKLPGIFKSKCFNDDELPFFLEVRKTESGHLFEHILLEYLCDLKIKNGSKFANYVGETSWNWKKEKRGLFHITVSAGYLEKDIFDNALSKTILLFNFILASGEYKKAPLLDQDLSGRLSFLGNTSS